MRYLYQYLRDLFTGWQGIMSSTASILFLMLGFLLKWQEKAQLRYWLIAAFGSYTLASYLAWYRNKPDLKIEARTVLLAENLQARQLAMKSDEVALYLYVVNTRHSDNALKNCKMFVKMPNEEIEGQANLSNLNFSWAGTNDAVLKQGHPHEIPLRFDFPSNDLDFDIRNSNYTLQVTDVYDWEYELKGTLPKEYYQHR